MKTSLPHPSPSICSNFCPFIVPRSCIAFHHLLRHSHINCNTPLECVASIVLSKMENKLKLGRMCGWTGATRAVLCVPRGNMMRVFALVNVNKLKGSGQEWCSGNCLFLARLFASGSHLRRCISPSHLPPTSHSFTFRRRGCLDFGWSTHTHSPSRSCPANEVVVALSRNL